MLESSPKVLVVIPARGGSKGIPRKNTRLLAGRPLITYSIRVAQLSKYKPEIVVTSDDDEILTIARKSGALVVKRDESLAGDAVTLDPVISDAYIKVGNSADLVVTIQPTSPLLTVASLDSAIATMVNNGSVETLVSVVDDTHLTWSQQNGKFAPNYSERLNRQYLPKTYKETGAFVVSRASLLKQGKRFGESVGVVELPNQESVDIDNLEDWALCEYYLTRKHIVFSVAGYKEIGMGHVYNCLSIAGGLTRYKITFVVDHKSTLACEKILSMNYPVVQVGADNSLVDTIDSLSPDIIINDRLDTNESYMLDLKRCSAKIVNIEDVGQGAIHADLVINAIYPEKEPLPKHYFGSRYFCLRDEFLLTEPAPVSSDVRRILVAFGGTDPNNFTKRVLSLISGDCEKREIKIDVVVGMGYSEFPSIADFEKLQFVTVYRNLGNISDFMNDADLVFTSAGRTTYELASLGRPTIVLAQNERETSHFFASAEYGFLNLGLGTNVSDNDILFAYEKCVASYDLRFQMHETMLAQDLKSGRKNVLKLIEEVILNA